MIDQISGILCDKLVNELESATLDKVNHVPTSYFNIFSGTKIPKNVWTMQGDKNAIVLTKGKHKILFDIKIPKTKGVIFANLSLPQH